MVANFVAPGSLGIAKMRAIRIQNELNSALGYK